MQSIHHMVMTTGKRSINSVRLQNHEFECSLQVLPTLPVRERHKTVISRGCPRGNGVEAHRNRTSGEVVGTQIPSGLQVEGANRLVLALATRNSEKGVDLCTRI